MNKLKFSLLVLWNFLLFSCGSRYQDDSAKYKRGENYYIEATITDRPDPCKGFNVPLECFDQPPGSSPGANPSTATGSSIGSGSDVETGCIGDCEESASSGSSSGEAATAGGGEDSSGAAIGDVLTSLGKETSKAWGKLRDEINGKNAERRRKAREAKKLLSQAKDLWAQAEVYRRSIDANRETLQASLASLQNSVAAADGDNLIQNLEKFRSTYNEQVRSILAQVPEVRDEAFEPGNDRNNESIYAEKAIIDQGRRYLDYAASKVEAYRSHRDYTARKKLISVSDNAIDESEASFRAGNFREGSQLFEFGMAAADIAISVTPVVGWGKDIYEATSGYGLVDGRKLTNFERSMAVFGVFTAGVGSKLAVAGKAGKISRILSKSVGRSEEASSMLGITKRAEKILDSAKNNGIDLRKLDADRFKHNPLTDKKYTDKVRAQMQADQFHGFPGEVDNFAGLGKKTEITGGDGIKRTRIELEGEYLGRKGNFEWIIEPNGSINHRKFEPMR